MIKRLVISFLAFLLIFVILAYRYYNDFIAVITIEKQATLSRCIDGDTAEMIVNGKKETVRLLAVDTPESVHPTKPVEPYGKEAAIYTCNLLEDANKITIEMEENTQKDKYGRTLAWVWIDSELIQLDLIEKGYAEVKYLYDDYKYTDILKNAQKEAKAKKLGIWN